MSIAEVVAKISSNIIITDTAAIPSLPLLSTLNDIYQSDKHNSYIFGEAKLII